MTDHSNNCWNAVQEYWKRLENRYDEEQKIQIKEISASLSSINKAITFHNEEDVEMFRKCRKTTTNEQYYFSPGVYNGSDLHIDLFIKPGEMVLFTCTVEKCSFWQSKEKFIPIEGLTLMLTRNRQEFELLFFSTTEKDLSSAICIKCGRKGWIYTKEKAVAFYLGERLISLEFSNELEAAQFPLKLLRTENIMHLFFDLESSPGTHLVQLYGECPQDQLNTLKFLEMGSSDAQLHVVELIKCLQSSANPDQLPVPELICQGDRIDSFLVQSSKFLKLLYEETMKLDISEEIRTGCSNLLKDLKTLRCVVPFCNCAHRVHSSPKSQMQDILNIIAVLLACERLQQCSEVYVEFHGKIINLKAKVEQIFPIKLEGNANYVISKNELKLLHKKLLEELENSRKQARINDPLKDIKTKQSFNLLERMCKYLDKDDCDAGCFDKLDKLLRIGHHRDIFNLYSENIRVKLHKLEEEAENEAVFCMFSESHVYLPGSSDNWQVHSEFDQSRRLNKKEMFSFISLIKTKVSQCSLILHEMLGSTKVYLNFDEKHWNTLCDIRKQIYHLNSVNSDANHETEFDLIDEIEQVSNCSASSKPADYQWKKYDPREFTFIRAIGEGAYGAVTLHKHEYLGDIVIKEFHYTTTSTELKKELDMTIRLQDNHYIVGLLGCLDDDDGELPRRIILEFIERSLDRYIHETEKEGSRYKVMYTIRHALEIVSKVANAVWAMHTLGLIHRDLKPQNILIMYRGGIRICDFGTCGEAAKTHKTENTGTCVYMSPEMINLNSAYNDYGPKTDVYSLAVTMWEIFHRKYPFAEIKGNYNVCKHACEEEKRPVIDEKSCPGRIADVIVKAWDQNPDSRYTMQTLEAEMEHLRISLPSHVLETVIDI